MSKSDKVIEKAKEWLSTKIDMDDIGKYHILVEKGEVIFWNFKEVLNKEEIIMTCLNSPDVKAAWYGTGDFINDLRVSYDNRSCEIIKRNDILKREWFDLSLNELKRLRKIDPRMGTFEFAKFNICFPYHSHLDWDKLEQSTGKTFDFERNFKKPKNKIYASIEA